MLVGKPLHGAGSTLMRHLAENWRCTATDDAKRACA